MRYGVRHDDALHEDAYIIVAFSDIVGIACDDDCAQDAVDDIIADHPDSDAGYDRASRGQVRQHRYCMGCGTEVSP